MATNIDRQAFAHSLVEEIIYNLDTRRIVGFKMKPWAESFLQLRVALADMYGENPAKPTSEPLYTQLHPEGYQTTLRDSIWLAIAVFKKLLYPLPRATMLPASSMIPTKVDRNQEIYDRYITNGADYKEKSARQVRKGSSGCN